jgi:hypothetical protein
MALFLHQLWPFSSVVSFFVAETDESPRSVLSDKRLIPAHSPEARFSFSVQTPLGY